MKTWKIRSNYHSCATEVETGRKDVHSPLKDMWKCICGTVWRKTCSLGNTRNSYYILIACSECAVLVMTSSCVCFAFWKLINQLKRHMIKIIIYRILSKERCKFNSHRWTIHTMMLVMMKQQNTLKSFPLPYSLNKETQEVSQVSLEPLQSVFVAGQGWANPVLERAGIRSRTLRRWAAASGRACEARSTWIF